MTRFIPRLTYANVVATLALIIALGVGSAWAADKLRKDSVKSKQIKAGAVKTGELADDAVTSPKIADGALQRADFAAGQIPVGATGPQGPQGDQGVPGQDATNLFAYVGSTGNLISGSGAINATRTGLGVYKVAFNRALSGCVANANVGTAQPPGDFHFAGFALMAHASQINADQSIEVRVWDHTAAALDSAFTVSVFC